MAWKPTANDGICLVLNEKTFHNNAINKLEKALKKVAAQHTNGDALKCHLVQHRQFCHQDARDGKREGDY